MKNSKEIADYVFKARDEYLEKQNKRKLLIGRIASFGTLGATVATVLICAINLLPILEENKFEVQSPSESTICSIEHTELTTHTTISPLPDTTENVSEDEGNTVVTDPTETIPLQTDIAVITKPVLTTSVIGMSDTNKSTMAVVTKPVMTSVIVLTQTMSGNTITENPVKTSVVIVTKPYTSTNSNITKPLITTIIASSPPPITTTANVIKPVKTTVVTETEDVTLEEIHTVTVSKITDVSQNITTAKVTSKPVTSKVTTSKENVTQTAISQSVIPQTSKSNIVSTQIIVTQSDIVVSSIVTQSNVVVSSLVRPITTVVSGVIMTEPTTIVTATVTSTVTETTEIIWDYDDIANQFSSVSLFGDNYMMTGNIADYSITESFLYSYEIPAINPQSGENCFTTITAYAVEGYDTGEYIGIRFNGLEQYTFIYQLST